LATLIQAVFMSVVVTAMGGMTLGGPTISTSALAGLTLWSGFITPSSLTDKVFADQLMPWLLEAGNLLTNFLIIDAILGAWR
jgi:hypothetical protein